MPSTRRSGVDSALPKVRVPVRSSKAAISVNVPPMSAARRRLQPSGLEGEAFISLLLEFRPAFAVTSTRTRVNPADGRLPTGGRRCRHDQARYRRAPPGLAASAKPRTKWVFIGKKYLIGAGTKGPHLRLARQLLLLA